MSERDDYADKDLPPAKRPPLWVFLLLAFLLFGATIVAIDLIVVIAPPYGPG